jgi:hypothetical protein
VAHPPPLQELLGKGAFPAIGGVLKTKIVIDLEKSLLLVVITCE